MCGITGFLNFTGEPVSPVILKKMTDMILHRGPDGEGFYTEGSVALGHRRLAIIDLSPAGHQPMITPDGRFVITYNGEVYNFQSLRLELEALGHQFRSRTDSEVILHAYAQWGSDCVTRLNGMFAFAIWDKQEQTLFLARDRFGIKPLYYYSTENSFLFASEIKAFIAHPGYKNVMNKHGLLEYLTFQNFFTNQTLFEGVRILPAGTCLTVCPDQPNSLQPVRYWDYHFSEPTDPLSENEYLEELDRLFVQAVNRQLISDVPVGSYLSGGMDSGSITAIAARQLPRMCSFTVGFDLHSASGMEMAFDEREKAEYMSYLFKTEHYEMVLKAGDMEHVLPEMAWHLEEPRVGQSYPNYYAARLASKFGKVVLSGAGGDELFGGYPWRYYRAVVNDHFEDYVDKYYEFWQRLVPQDVAADLFAPVAEHFRQFRPREIFKQVFSDHPNELSCPEDYVNHSLYFEAKTFLHGLLLVDDKLSMAHSLEGRVPFLDNDLVDFAMRLPARLKLGNLDEVIRVNENDLEKKVFFERNRDGKLILRKMMERYIPREVTEREKQGFSAPDASWFRGESLDYVRRKLFSRQARIYDYLDRSVVEKLLNEHLEGRQNRRLLIWSLLSVEHWCEKFL